MTQHLKAYLRSWRQYPIMQIATISVLTASYCVVILFLSLFLNFDRILTQWGDTINISVYLHDDLSAKELKQLQKEIESIEEVEDVSLVSKSEAAERFKKQMNQYAPSLIEDPEFARALPASLEVNLRRSMKAQDQYEKLVALAGQITQMGGVEDVSYGHGWVENYASVVRAFSTTSGMLVFVLAVGSLFVVGNSIRNSVSQRREEIEVLELVGATPAMIRGPYIFEGAVSGFISTSLALSLGFLIYFTQNQISDPNITLWGIKAAFQFISIGEAALAVLAGTSVGAIGAYISVRRISTGWSATQRIEAWGKM